MTRQPSSRRARGASGGRSSGSGSSRRSRGLGGEQIEGRRAVRELLAAGRREVHRVALAAEVSPGPLVTEILELATERRVRVERVSAEEIESRATTGAPQGVVARAEPVVAAEVASLLAEDRPFLVALDGVTDPRNLGAVLRTAEAAGATGVVLPRHRGVRLTPAAVKAAAGAVEYLPIATVAGVSSFLEQCRRAEVWSVGLDERGGQSLDDIAVADGPLVLVLGAEGDGLSRLAAARCDLVAGIPMRGHLASLNVGAAAAIACFWIASRRSAERG